MVIPGRWAKSTSYPGASRENKKGRTETQRRACNPIKVQTTISSAKLQGQVPIPRVSPKWAHFNLIYGLKTPARSQIMISLSFLPWSLVFGNGKNEKGTWSQLLGSLPRLLLSHRLPGHSAAVTSDGASAGAESWPESSCHFHPRTPWVSLSLKTQWVGIFQILHSQTLLESLIKGPGRSPATFPT